MSGALANASKDHGAENVGDSTLSSAWSEDLPGTAFVVDGVGSLPNFKVLYVFKVVMVTRSRVEKCV